MSDPLRPAVNVERDDDGQMSVSVAAPVGDEAAKARMMPLAGFLDVSDPDPAEQEKLQAIWGYLDETVDSELESERLWAIRDIEQKLAHPRLGQTRLDQVYRYVQLDREARRVDKARNSLLK